MFRDRPGKGHPDTAVTRRSRAAAAGLGLAAIYLVLASVSAHLDPFAARPVLDGLAPPPPYHWADPPPALESSNEPPASGRFAVGYAADAGSSAGVFSTSDQQVTVALTTGSIGALDGTSSITLTITPSAPASDLILPDGATVAGNVIRVEATYDPQGEPISALAKPGEIVLAYPVVYTGDGSLLRIMTSQDGRTWTSLKTRGAIVHQLVRARITSLGYFAVGQVPPAKSSPSRDSTAGVAILLAALFILAILILVVVFRRRRRRTPPPARRPPPAPRERGAFDPWES
jgi:hypothetical protein